MSRPHPAARALLRSALHVAAARDDLEGARREGQWPNWRANDDSARNAVRDIDADLARVFDRLEKLTACAANTPPERPLTLKAAA